VAPNSDAYKVANSRERERERERERAGETEFTSGKRRNEGRQVETKKWL